MFSYTVDISCTYVYSFHLQSSIFTQSVSLFRFGLCTSVVIKKIQFSWATYICGSSFIMEIFKWKVSKKWGLSFWLKNLLRANYSKVIREATVCWIHILAQNYTTFSQIIYLVFIDIFFGSWNENILSSFIFINSQPKCALLRNNLIKNMDFTYHV